MKLKRILIMASAAAASSGLLATVLTSCSKSKIDDDLKINLDDSGLFTKSKDFKVAVKNALSSTKTWKTFKTALADELVYQWYNDRASSSKDSKDKNNRFRDNIEEWKYNIDEDYKDKVDEYKSKYGSNHKFYLQNELLSAHGGTEESYKHEQLVAKIKEDFISNVFDKNYFGLAKAEPTGDYPHIFTDVESTIYLEDLKNPDSWKRIGFFAKANPSFPVKKDDWKPNELAKNPDGDYATIQSYVFDRWFKTEKPFFSAAALFKYSKPAKSEQKLSNIYNVNAVTVPDEPNETFPFFGGMTDSSTTNGLTGTRAFWHWWKQMNQGTFVYDGRYDDEGEGTTESFNGAISIPKNYTEDSQTLLLCFGSQMIGGASNSLYIPYAVSAASLYHQMMTGTKTWVLNDVLQSAIQVPTDEPLYDDTDTILRIFFSNGEKKPAGIASALDLRNIYPAEGEFYHCPLFKQNDDFSFLYGDNDTQGVTWITNNVQSDLTPSSEATTKLTKGSFTQPWIFELNEAGMHVQTIDCFSFVQNITQFDSTATKNEALKRAVMFRLMQKEKNLAGSDIISASVLGKDGALKTYFNDNFADIVLEIACSDVKGINVFRTIESYDDATLAKESKFLFNTWKDEQLGTGDAAWSALVDYLNQTSKFDRVKKNHDAVITANDKIYAYRTTQITNSADNKGKKIFENGLLAPLAIKYTTSDEDNYNTTHNYADIWWLITSAEDDVPAGFDDLETILSSSEITTFVNEVTKADVKVDSASGFSLQVAKAKEVSSNRAWFKSAIVDKMMYGYMGDKALATEIKYDAYKAYDDKNKIAGLDGTLPTDVEKALASAHKAPKLFSDSKNFASYTPYAKGLDFFTVINPAYTNYLANDIIVNGQFSDEQLNEKLFRATVKYLAKNDFENYYKELNRKIGDDIFAFTGYLSKYDTTDHAWLKDPEKATLGTDLSPYAWKPEVGNIFDQYGYGGNSTVNPYDKTNARTDYDQYWNVLDNKFTGDTKTSSLSGFLGLQTSASNQLDDSSGLKSAVLDKFAISTENSVNLLDSSITYGNNYGALFQWAGRGIYSKDSNAITNYTFPAITYKDHVAIKPEMFSATDSDGHKMEAALKLAKRIAESSTVDDLKKLAKTINEKYEGGSVFEDIAKNNYEIDWNDQLNQIKYMMLSSEEGLLSKDEDGKYAFYYAFQRVTNAEVHGEIASPYCFENEKDGYKLILSELNKSDVLEHTIHPRYTGSSWVMVDGSGITAEEFWFIFFKLAADTTIQQSATADVVKTIYGDDKLVVYDAQLYNQFDAVWIKDWKKKPIGE